MLVSALRDEVIKEVGGDTADADLQDKVLGFMKSALRRLPQNARARSIISKESVSLSAAASTGTIPTGFIQERAVWYESGGMRKEIEVIRDVRLFNAQYRSDGVGDPQFCRFYGSVIEFNRLADQAYTVYIDCFKSIDDVAASDSFAYDSNIAEVIKDGAKFYYFTYTEEKDQQSMFGNLFTGGLQGLDGKFQRDETPDYIEEA